MRFLRFVSLSELFRVASVEIRLVALGIMSVLGVLWAWMKRT
jgi:hypothetical protein